MVIEKLEDFYKFLQGYTLKNSDYVFRGVKSIDYKLIPTIGRVKTKNDSKEFTIVDEEKMLSLFRQKAYPFLDKNANDLEVLAIAQHHGLPTRLLDWTWNPLVALYFAVRDEWKEETKKDSVVYAWEKDRKGQLMPDFKPFAIKEVELFLPQYVSKRIIAQSGIFTIHPKPTEEFNNNHITKVVIKSKIRPDIKIQLEKLGIHQGTMFLDLDGIATYIKWLQTKTH